ncbi:MULTISPECIES: NAD(P)H-dependent oxidoreductase [Paenibacillus]|uniref:Putative NADPH-quinone reductase n=1 Tax=Paenibacillus pabuli TaxID=1472 RepID=A0A855XQN2_9BACL|nr:MULTISPECIES: NAD(P)H-dependent oxidoreductase [Paenibacillus]PWW37156.1 putative NADPH-quinone reductase [Paenibacillus pabuli]PXW05299.1 putative NADPH-quinone reductase [Paenibacillus taichungensis]
MKSNILVINGHPDPQSYCKALSEAYVQGARKSGSSVELIDLSHIQFNLNLQYGYRQRTELEPDLVRAQELIRWADHLVFVYPTWWGVMPAILKGFIDRVFLPGFAMKDRENSPLWDKLLKGRSAQIIVTMDTPRLYNRFIYRHAGHRVMKSNILKFCGISPVRVTEVSPIKGSTEAFRLKWLNKMMEMGMKQGGRSKPHDGQSANSNQQV